MIAGDRPRVAFLGLGWIGRQRLSALLESNLVEVAALADPEPEALAEAARLVPRARLVPSYDALLTAELDGLVISTPSAQHAAECRRAFADGLAVFCQKPLSRNAVEVESVLRAARSADRLLRVDFGYRHTRALQRARDLIRQGEIGRVFAAELQFHNAYGPDKPWARDWALAGGGCLIDLGVHLIDGAFYCLDESRLVASSTSRFAEGRGLPPGARVVEDYAVAHARLEGGAALSLACSWRSSFGDHARIRWAFFGSAGGVAVENVAGSFFDFACTRYRGAAREELSSPPDEWAGRAIVGWANELRESNRHRADDRLYEVAQALDRMYEHEPAAPLARVDQERGALAREDATS